MLNEEFRSITLLLSRELENFVLFTKWMKIDIVVTKVEIIKESIQMTTFTFCGRKGRKIIVK